MRDLQLFQSSLCNLDFSMYSHLLNEISQMVLGHSINIVRRSQINHINISGKGEAIRCTTIILSFWIPTALHCVCEFGKGRLMLCLSYNCKSYTLFRIETPQLSLPYCLSITHKPSTDWRHLLFRSIYMRTRSALHDGM